MSTKVFIADDHSIVREGIKTILERSDKFIEVVGEAENGREVIAFAEKHRADVYILDISMPFLNGLETAERLRKISPDCKIIILSMYDNRTSVEKAFSARVNGYLIKESAIDEIVHAVQEVQLGRFFLSPGISNYVVEGFLDSKSRRKSKTVVDLTSKEKEIIQLLAEGFSSKEIAMQLHTSFNTVNVHKKNIMQKLCFHKSAELVRYAIKEGISKL